MTTKTSTPISIVDAFNYYQKEAQQLEAVKYLDGAITPEIRDKFGRIFRGETALRSVPNRKHGDLADRVYQCCKDRDFPLSKGLGEVNIIGIEGIDLNGTFNPDTPDRWNDLVGLLTFENGYPVWKCLYVGTTEPGKYYILNPMNILGGARLDTGYHSAIWQVGKHRGYTALQQTGVARLVRDANRNNRRDDKITSERWKGINLHTTKTTGWRGSYNQNSIGKWSAGCTVIQKPEEFQSFMKAIMQSSQYRRNSAHMFDYRLIWSRWLK